MARSLVRLSAAFCLVASTGSFAAGLGNGQLNSSLGQPLDVQFDVLTKSEENVSERCFRLNAPLDRDPSGEDILRGKLSLEKISAERALLRLRSNTPVHEPVISVTLRLDCGSGVLVRRYTFLPDLKAAARNTETDPQTSAADRAGDAPAPAKANVQAAALAKPAKPIAPRRRGGHDRISLNTLTPPWQDKVDRPLQLKLSPLLDLGRAVTERTPQQLAIAKLERRLAELSSGDESNPLSPEQRLQQLIGLLGEAQAISGQIATPVNLPKVNEPAAIPPPPLAAPAPGAPTTQPAERPKTPPVIPPENSALPGETIGLLVALIIVAVGTTAILWFRARAATPKPLRPLSRRDKPLGDSAPLRDSLADGNDIFRQAGQAGSAPPAMDALQESVSSISVSHGFEQEYDDPFTAHLEAAEIMICFGRFQSAAAEVLAYVEENPDCGLRPRLALLDIYRRGDMKTAFETTVNSLSGQFNVALPEWRAQSAPVTARNLDNFPHIVARICELWESDGCLPYIQHLTTDTRGGTRSGFDIAAAEELALLEAMLRLRGKDSAKAGVETH